MFLSVPSGIAVPIGTGLGSILVSWIVIPPLGPLFAKVTFSNAVAAFIVWFVFCHKTLPLFEYIVISNPFTGTS
jgi:hypothetical protein